MSNTMLAAVVKRFKQPMTIERVEIPAPGPGEVLVRIHATGVCHTDVHAADGDWPVKPNPPFIAGHEGAGVVIDLGDGVRNLKIGDRVGIPWLHDACGHCDACQSGWETLCPNQHNSGYSVNGSFAEFAIARADFAARIPDALSFADAAPILCAGVTTYKGLKETEARPGQWVAISGIGGLGHVAVQYARAMGLHVAAIDIADDKLELARRHGAEIVVNARKDDPSAALQKAIGGAHASLITAVSTSAFAAGLGVLRSGGTCVLVGLPPGDFPTPIFDVVLKRLTLRGSIVGTRRDLAEALAFAAEGKVRATIETQPLAEINTVFDRLRAGKVDGRVVLGLGARASRPQSSAVSAGD
ncbi:MAG TPA: alcohol dehydrogenase AdhP [Thermoanaerobaculia bacterium]|nr:alcohol dehydrogenase AdhP [Thermoanaerobaculia bacterium]